jgi:hypothetical protein
MAILSDVAKPGTIGAALISKYTDSNGFGNDDTAFNKVLVKTETVQIAAGVQVIETTGDGDTEAKYDHGSLLRVRFTLTGYALANDVIGLQELESDTVSNAEGNGDYLMEFKYHGSTRSISGRAMIESIAISYTKKSPVVALQMSGYLRIDPSQALEKANTP